MRNDAIPSPWNEFLAEVDRKLTNAVELQCIDGFVCVKYGLPRPTNDIDYYSIQPIQAIVELQEIAGPGTKLAQKYGLYFQPATVPSLPEDYETRLSEMFPGAFQKLRLFAPDPYDHALSKLERNLQRDREDVEFLARTVPLKAEVLRERYEKELRPYLTNESLHDSTLKLWLEAYFAPQPNQS